MLQIITATRIWVENSSLQWASCFKDRQYSIFWPLIVQLVADFRTLVISQKVIISEYSEPSWQTLGTSQHVNVKAQVPIAPDCNAHQLLEPLKGPSAP